MSFNVDCNWHHPLPAKWFRTVCDLVKSGRRPIVDHSTDEVLALADRNSWLRDRCAYDDVPTLKSGFILTQLSLQTNNKLRFYSEMNEAALGV